MSEPEAVDIVDVDARAWVEAAANDPVLYRERQVTEIVLSAIGLAPTLSANLVLKGGTLMALAFGTYLGRRAAGAFLTVASGA